MKRLQTPIVPESPRKKAKPASSPESESESGSSTTVPLSEDKLNADSALDEFWCAHTGGEFHVHRVGATKTDWTGHGRYIVDPDDELAVDQTIRVLHNVNRLKLIDGFDSEQKLKVLVVFFLYDPSVIEIGVVETIGLQLPVPWQTAWKTAADVGLGPPYVDGWTFEDQNADEIDGDYMRVAIVVLKRPDYAERYDEAYVYTKLTAEQREAAGQDLLKRLQRFHEQSGFLHGAVDFQHLLCVAKEDAKHPPRFVLYAYDHVELFEANRIAMKDLDVVSQLSEDVQDLLKHEGTVTFPSQTTFNELADAAHMLRAFKPREDLEYVYLHDKASEVPLNFQCVVQFQKDDANTDSEVFRNTETDNVLLQLDKELAQGKIGSTVRVILQGSDQKKSQKKVLKLTTFDDSINTQAELEDEFEAASVAGSPEVQLGPKVDGRWICPATDGSGRKVFLMLMDYIEGPTLADYWETLDSDEDLAKEGKRLFELLAPRLLNYLKTGHLHRDIHERNIMLDKDFKNAWLIDYGFAHGRSAPHLFLPRQHIFLQNWMRTKYPELAEEMKDLVDYGVSDPPSALSAAEIDMFLLADRLRQVPHTDVMQYDAAKQRYGPVLLQKASTTAGAFDASTCRPCAAAQALLDAVRNNRRFAWNVDELQYWPDQHRLAAKLKRPKSLHSLQTRLEALTTLLGLRPFELIVLQV